MATAGEAIADSALVSTVAGWGFTQYAAAVAVTPLLTAVGLAAYGTVNTLVYAASGCRRQLPGGRGATVGSSQFLNDPNGQSQVGNFPPDGGINNIRPPKNEEPTTPWGP